MRCVYFLLCISAVVRLHAAVSVKKLLYVEASVDVKNMSKEGLTNTLEDLKKVLCMPGEECQDQKRYPRTTYRPYEYTTRSPSYLTSPVPTRNPWYTTPYRPYYYTTRRPSNTTYYGPTGNPWYTTPYRPYYYTTRRSSNTTYYGSTGNPWYTTPYRPYYYTTRRPSNTTYYGSTGNPWYTTHRPYYPDDTTRNDWNSTTYRPYRTTVYRPYRETNESDWTVSTNRTYTTSTPFNETWTTDYFDEGERALIDCSDLPPHSPSGVYNISAEDGQVQVFCDMKTDGGYWTVIQNNNFSSRLTMNNSWEEYRDGFGKINDVFWLGNKQVSDMTTRRRYTLRVDMKDIHGSSIFAKYGMFQVEPEEENFRLHVDNFSGTAGDGLVYHDKGNFSTYDVDNDYDGQVQCPQNYGAGWWYRSCFLADLNINFPLWITSSLATSEMKIRPAEL